MENKNESVKEGGQIDRKKGRKEKEEEIMNEINTTSITTPVYRLDVYQFSLCGGGGGGGCCGGGVVGAVVRCC